MLKSSRGGKAGGRSKTNVPQALVGAVGKKGKSISIDDIVKKRRINPNYRAFGDPKFTKNCQRCVYAAEMARRGYDVEAVGRESNATDKWYTHWRHGFNGQTWDGHLGNRNATVEKNINAKLQSWGDGARAIVYVKWKGVNSAHVFNVENVNGKTVAYDAQKGRKFPIMDYLKDSQPTYTQISRVDHLTDPNPLLQYAMKKRGT